MRKSYLRETVSNTNDRLYDIPSCHEVFFVEKTYRYKLCNAFY